MQAGTQPSMTDLLNAEFVSQRLAAAAAAHAVVGPVSPTTGNAWMIELERSAPCLVEIESDNAGMVLSADVGAAPEGRHAEVRGAALSYNALWRETGGARIVQAGETGELTLLRQFSAAAVASDRFPADVAQFLKSAVWWAAYAGMAPAASCSELSRKRKAQQQSARDLVMGLVMHFEPRGLPSKDRSVQRAPSHSMALPISSTTFFASPNTIMVLSM